jgi:hypothetical protein
MGSLTRAIIHHTAGTGDYSTSLNTSKSNMRGVQNYHMDSLGWCDIAYHFLVDAGGNIFEGRAGSMASLPQGAHDSYNVNSFGFTCLGYFHPPYNQDVTSGMLDSLYDTIAWRMPSGWSPYGSGSYNGNTVGFLDGHRSVKATACPGDGVWAYIGSNFNGGDARNGVNCRKNGTCNTSFKPAVFRNATWHLRKSKSAGDADITYNYGTAGDIPVMGDWDGNGSITPGVFRPSNGTWYLRNSNTGGVADHTFQYGQAGDRPVAGDWDGNGNWSVGVYRPSNTTWYLRNALSTGGSTYSFVYGAGEDLPVAGDWNGNGAAGIGVFRPSTGTFYLRNSLIGGGSDYTFNYGTNGDLPVAGDWNGDGITTVGVFRPSEATWYLRNFLSAGGSSYVFAYGITTDLPVVWK